VTIKHVLLAGTQQLRFHRVLVQPGVILLGRARLREANMRYFPTWVRACVHNLCERTQDKYGGWLSEDVVADFTHYARSIFDAFRDRVVYWTTFNEPWSFCFLGYGLALHAPGRSSDRCAAGRSLGNSRRVVSCYTVLLGSRLGAAPLGMWHQAM